MAFSITPDTVCIEGESKVYMYGMSRSCGAESSKQGGSGQNRDNGRVDPLRSSVYLFLLG